MHFSLVIILIIGLRNTFAMNTESIHLIKSYFKEKSVKYARVFTCLSKQEQIKFFRELVFDGPISVGSLSQQEISKKLYIKYAHLGVIIQGNCTQSHDFLKTSGKLNFFDVRHHWLLLSSNNISQNFENVESNINSDIQAAHPEPSSLNWDIFDVYNPASQHGGKLNITKVGFFRPISNYKILKNEGKYSDRRNLTGVTFRSLVVLPVDFKGPLNAYLKSDEDRIVNTFNRFHNKLLGFCQDYYNYSLIIGAEKSWGYTKDDGTFDGMVGGLQNKEIDFGSSPLFFREDRSRVIDYGRNTWILRATFIFRNPKAPASMEIFFQPLPTSAWLITAFLAVTSIFLLKIVANFERNKFDEYLETNWGIPVILTFGALCQQGAAKTSNLTCGRITTISVFLLSVLIYQFYSASLVSHLLMKPVVNIRNIKDILDSSLKAGCEEILYDRDYFKHTTDPVAIDLHEKKILGKGNQSNFMTPGKGLLLVEKGGFAFHIETATAYPIIEETFEERTICDLKEVPLFRTQPMHANYQKNSPFRDMFDTW